jgi:hypothetical protein
MGSAEAAAAAMKVLGYSVEWEPTGETTSMIVPDASNGGLTTTTIEIPSYRAIVTDGLGNTENTNKFDYGKIKDGGGSKKKDWENPYDKHYNTLEQINEALREREKLERRYQRLLEQSDTKGGDLVKNAEQQIEKAEDEIALRKKLRN